MRFATSLPIRERILDRPRPLFCLLLLSALLFAGEGVLAADETMVHPAGHGTTVPSSNARHQDGTGDDEPHVHVHPVAAPEQAGEVGLEERLGEFIPMDLPFLDEQGREISLKELITVPTIIAPVYYKCPNVCTFLQGGLARVLNQVKRTPGEDFRIISVSFDETETPELARKSKAIYMEAMEGRFPEDAWRFLTGSPENIRLLTEAAGYRFMRQGADFLHPVAIFVVSEEGKIVRYLHGTRYLPMDLTLALIEASEGRVGTTIRKVVSFCFSYDPENKTYVFNLMRVSATVVMATAGTLLGFLLLTGRRKKDT
ncbi:MAG: SCO family protein [Desulfuromonas sp.]|uniref:SCO family protein n=1 Tax=Desulfuromonas sp. TaxID=892 RepID=UPI000CC43725|nr:SCO family protein [Desulfuromonas sp.]PLX81631.1 MAG: SCO family protein [Desulfuromonas sp.]